MSRGGFNSKDDIALIRAAKAKNNGITCDVSLYSLLFSAAQLVGSDPAAAAGLPEDVQLSGEDQAALWQNLDVVDVLTAGTACALDDDDVVRRLRYAMSFALTAVSSGRMSLADLTARFHDNPLRIFGRSPQGDTSVVVEIDRPAARVDGHLWPAAQREPQVQPTHGYVSRVIVRGRTFYLDGRMIAKPGEGQAWRVAESAGGVTAGSAPLPLSAAAAASPAFIGALGGSMVSLHATGPPASPVSLSHGLGATGDSAADGHGPKPFQLGGSVYTTLVSATAPVTGTAAAPATVVPNVAAASAGLVAGPVASAPSVGGGAVGAQSSSPDDIAMGPESALTKLRYVDV